MSRVVLVFGSTGVQGTAFIEALARHNQSAGSSDSWKIIAVTRNPSGGSAKYLSSLNGVTCLKAAENNQDEPDKVFKALGSELGIKRGQVHGVVSIQGYVDDPTMIKQGHGIAKAAKDYGVQHLIYSSSDIGPPDEQAMHIDVPTFGFKVREVEPYIRELFPGQYTMLRPVQFMNLLLPTQGFPFRAGRWVMLRYTYTANSNNKMHQLISPNDIGKAGVKALIDGPGWKDGIVRLASWQGQVKEIEAIHKEVFGKDVQGVPWPLPVILKRAVPFLRDFTKFWSDYGYRVDINALKRDIPLEDLRTYFELEKAKMRR